MRVDSHVEDSRFDCRPRVLVLDRYPYSHQDLRRDIEQALRTRQKTLITAHVHYRPAESLGLQPGVNGLDVGEIQWITVMCNNTERAISVFHHWYDKVALCTADLAALGDAERPGGCIDVLSRDTEYGSFAEFVDEGHVFRDGQAGYLVDSSHGGADGALLASAHKGPANESAATALFASATRNFLVCAHAGTHACARARTHAPTPRRTAARTSSPLSINPVR